MILATAGVAILFALVHLGIGRLAFLHAVPRSRWLSFAGGVAVAYVLLHLLPELAAHEARLRAAGVERLAYVAALAGLALFYGLERAVRRPRADGGETGEAVFWLHIGSFALYNLLIGYLLLHREESGLRSLALYGSAMLLHFVTNDFGLRQDHTRRWDRSARWLLAAAVLLGWALGLTVAVPPAAVAILFAFLAGAVLLNVLKEELPADRRSRFLPFALGTAGYAAVLLAT